MSEKVPGTTQDGTISPWVILIGAGGAVFAMASLVRTGYEMGINQSRKILRRHDKDKRKEDKRWRLYFKEQRKLNKQRAKGGP